jgi:23S rRNA pseudouridine1911/1915/1917 synthase
VVEWRAPDRGRALVRAFPERGRRHQIRVHLAAAGHPILGDKLYADGERHYHNSPARGLDPAMVLARGAARQLLHAARLGFAHPRDGRPVTLEAPLPGDFAAALAGAAGGGAGQAP